MIAYVLEPKPRHPWIQGPLRGKLLRAEDVLGSLITTSAHGPEHRTPVLLPPSPLRRRPFLLAVRLVAAMGKSSKDKRVRLLRLFALLLPIRFASRLLTGLRAGCSGHLLPEGQGGRMESSQRLQAPPDRPGVQHLPRYQIGLPACLLTLLML